MTRYEDILKSISSGLQTRAEDVLKELVDLLEPDLMHEDILIWIKAEYYELTGVE